MKKNKKYSSAKIFASIFFNCAVVIYLLLMISCNKILETPAPVTGLSKENIFQNDNTAAAAVTGIYQTICLSSGELSGGLKGMSVELGLAGDELQLPLQESTLLGFYTNQLSLFQNNDAWNDSYGYIYQCNAAIEGLANSTTLSPAIKEQLTGEVKFMRSLLYFYLVNEYGDVPLLLSADYRVNATASRTPKENIYEQIVSDLQEAQTLLTEEYRSSGAVETNEKIRPNKSAVRALLARIYLYRQQWTEAEMMASVLINDSTKYKLCAGLDEVFLANSTESILQLYPTQPGLNTFDGNVFVLNDNFNSNSPVAMSERLSNAFESNDARFVNWVGQFNGYNFPYKYKVKGPDPSAPITEYVMVLRLAEQYLIRAEARAQTGKLTEAVEDLNVIRRRAGLPDYAGTLDAETVLNTIMHERQVELFAESGHRWFDLIRTNRIDAVMTEVCPEKGGAWDPNAKLFPIPDYPMNPNLTNNPGYN